MIKIIFRKFNESDFERDSKKYHPIVSGQSGLYYFVFDVFINDIFFTTFDLYAFRDIPKNDVVQYINSNNSYVGIPFGELVSVADKNNLLIIEKI